MKKYEQNSQQMSNISQFQSEGSCQLNAEQINNLHSSKQNFLNWVQTIGECANMPLSPNSLRYSKQIKNGNFDSVQILALMERRVEKMLKNHKIKKNWCKQDCTILAWILQKMTNGRHIRSPQKIKYTTWQTIATLIPVVTADQCMFKWLSMKLSHNKWSQQQSKILQQVIRQQGHQDWKKISRILYLHNQSADKKFRTPKQCREQWNCYLNPIVKKGPWSVQEDLKLLKNVEKIGRKWSMICKQNLPGRTQNAVKNRYNFLIEHKKKQYAQENQSSLLKICINYLEQILNRKQNKQSESPTQSQKASSFKQINLNQSKNDNQNCQQQIVKVQQQQLLPKITIVQCNFQQITKYLKTNHILVPAKIEKDQLIQFNGINQKCFKVQFNQYKKDYQFNYNQT